MPERDVTQTQAMDWGSTSGESFGSGRNDRRPPHMQRGMAQPNDWGSTSGESFGSGRNDHRPPPQEARHMNLAVRTDRLQNPQETATERDSTTLNWLHNQTEDDVQSERSSEQRRNLRSEQEVPGYQNIRPPPQYQHEVNFADYITPLSEEVTESVRVELREGFVFRCVAVSFIYCVSDSIRFKNSFIWLIPGLAYMLATPVTTVGTLWNCMHKKTAIVAIFGIFLLDTRNRKIDENFYYICLLIIMMHGVMRRLEAMPTILKLHGNCKETWSSSMWTTYCHFSMLRYLYTLSLCLSADFAASEDDIRYIIKILNEVYFLGILTVPVSVFTDGWNRYEQVEPVLNQNFFRKVQFAGQYLITRIRFAHNSITVDYYLYFINIF